MARTGQWLIVKQAVLFLPPRGYYSIRALNSNGIVPLGPDLPGLDLPGEPRECFVCMIAS